MESREGTGGEPPGTAAGKGPAGKGPAGRGPAENRRARRLLGAE